MRALIGRASDPALQEALVKRNIDCLFVKLLDIQPMAPPPDLDRRLGQAQAVLLTSANAVRALAIATTRRDPDLLTVGGATAETARSLGFHSVASAGGDVAALAALARQRSDPAYGALLYLRGEDVAGDLAGMLTQSRFKVDQIVLYRAQPVAQLPMEIKVALERDQLDLAAFFSPRSAASFASLVAAAGLAEKCRKIALAALSEAVARAADLPWAMKYVAQLPSGQSLLAAIDRWIKEQKQST
jgi:uroporphyrinogen-III synthase